VGKSVKEYALGFRRGEKVVHACVASLMLFLAATGIFIYHYGAIVPAWHYETLRWLHIAAGVLLTLVPILYFLLDSKHMERAFRHAFQFGEADRIWLEQFWAYIKNPFRTSLPYWGEFNTYHKFWYVYLSLVLPILALTGLLSAFSRGDPGGATSNLTLWIHSGFALSTDILVVVHIYIKLARLLVSNTADMVRSVKQKGDLHYPFLYDTRG